VSEAYGLVVIGSGPGGYAAAMAGSRRGWRVALVERGALGGVCLNVGCIPTKALIASAHAARIVREAGAFGVRAESPTIDGAAVLARARRVVEDGRNGLAGLLRQHRVEVIRGSASFDDPHTIRVSIDGQTTAIAAERIVIATGASPSSGPWRFDGERILSYRELLELPTLPESLLIIGGGVIGCEFASCCSQLGVVVTLVEQQPQLLPTEDPEAVRVIVRRLQAYGVTIAAGTTVRALGRSADGDVVAELSSGQSVQAQRCLVAVGLRPNTRDLGLERIGVRGEQGVEVDDSLRTAHPHIAAIGDCVPGHGLAHLASAEGLAAVRNLAGPTAEPFDRRVVPRCVYTDPELAQVGLLESQADSTVRVSRFNFAALGKAMCDGETEGFVKLLVDPATDRVVGATIVGAHASDLIHVAGLAIHHGMTATQLARSITAHPTWPESISEAAAQIHGEALYTSGLVRAPRRTAAVSSP